MYTSESNALSEIDGDVVKFVFTEHDDVIQWRYFPRYWPFVRGIHRSPVNSPHKGQWRRALMSSLICVWINGCVNNREAGDLRRHRAHYDVIVIFDVLKTNEDKSVLTVGISIRISLIFVPNAPVDNKLALVQVMPWPNRRQAIIWTNADPVHRRIYAALGGGGGGGGGGVNCWVWANTTFIGCFKHLLWFNKEFSHHCVCKCSSTKW